MSESFIFSSVLIHKACLGYGRDVPRESEDILCTIFSIMVGATFFALFIGNLSSILINVDVAQKKYAEILNEVSIFAIQGSNYMCTHLAFKITWFVP